MEAGFDKNDQFQHLIVDPGDIKSGQQQPAVSPLINLETQHDGRSAQVWMKRVLLVFVVVMGGQKGFAREHQNGF